MGILMNPEQRLFEAKLTRDAHLEQVEAKLLDRMPGLIDETRAFSQLILKKEIPYPHENILLILGYGIATLSQKYHKTT